MRINTGKGTIPLMTLIAIWSISLVVNLPGLAITPILGHLDRIFPHTTELEIQLLTVLPNLLIIPFVLLSGKLSLSKNKATIVVVALVIYLASGILYFFARSIAQLIVISCILGVGCGLLIPLAAGLLADTFVGKYRMRQLGIKSGISNIALVAATFVVGWLNKGNWHMPFLVYLIPAIPLVLSVFLKGIPKEDYVPANSVPDAVKEKVAVAQKTAIAGSSAKAIAQAHISSVSAQPVSGERVHAGFIVGRIWGLIAVYFLVCYGGVIISYYTPFLVQSYGLSSSMTGTITALFFLAVFLPGFILPAIVKVFKQSTLPVCALSMAVGIGVMVMSRHFGVMCLGALLTGFGYGVFQPLIYDKATQTVTSPVKSTLALAFVLTANYLSVSVTPFIVDGLCDLFGKGSSNTFPFILNSVIMLVFTVVVILFRKSFVFRIDRSYY